MILPLTPVIPATFVPKSTRSFLEIQVSILIACKKSVLWLPHFLGRYYSMTGNCRISKIFGFIWVISLPKILSKRESRKISVLEIAVGSQMGPAGQCSMHIRWVEFTCFSENRKCCPLQKHSAIQNKFLCWSLLWFSASCALDEWKKYSDATYAKVSITWTNTPVKVHY